MKAFRFFVGTLVFSVSCNASGVEFDRFLNIVEIPELVRSLENTVSDRQKFEDVVFQARRYRTLQESQRRVASEIAGPNHEAGIIEPIFLVVRSAVVGALGYFGGKYFFDTSCGALLAAVPPSLYYGRKFALHLRHLRITKAMEREKLAITEKLKGIILQD